MLIMIFLLLYWVIVFLEVFLLLLLVNQKCLKMLIAFLETSDDSDLVHFNFIQEISVQHFRLKFSNQLYRNSSLKFFYIYHIPLINWALSCSCGIVNCWKCKNKMCECMFIKKRKRVKKKSLSIFFSYRFEHSIFIKKI